MRKDVRHGEGKRLPGVALERHLGVDRESESARQRRAHRNPARRDHGCRIGRRHHDRIVGLAQGIVVITPQPAFSLLHAAQTADLVQVAGGNQVVTAGHHALHNHVGRARQHLRRFPSQRMGEQHHRCQQEHDRRIDEQQAEVLHLAARQRGQREVNQVFLFFDPGSHGRWSVLVGAVQGSHSESARGQRDGPETRCADRPAPDGGCSALP